MKGGTKMLAIYIILNSYFIIPRYPWRCLWRGFLQTMRRTRLRTITRQSLQRGRMEGRTFIDYDATGGGEGCSGVATGAGGTGFGGYPAGSSGRKR